MILIATLIIVSAIAVIIMVRTDNKSTKHAIDKEISTTKHSPNPTDSFSVVNNEINIDTFSKKIFIEKNLSLSDCNIAPEGLENKEIISKCLAHEEVLPEILDDDIEAFNNEVQLFLDDVMYQESLSTLIYDNVPSHCDHKKTEVNSITSESYSNIIEELKRYGVYSLYHMTHISNLSSILHYGILSNNEAHGRNMVASDISDPMVQRWRDREDPFYHRPIHAYAPLYINPRNPMLYVRRELQSNICILEISCEVLNNCEYIFTDGNASSHNTRFYNKTQSLKELPWDVLRSGRWVEYSDGKRKMCSEFLVYPMISEIHINRVHFYSKEAFENNKILSNKCSHNYKLFF